jgi:hypothetical protein
MTNVHLFCADSIVTKFEDTATIIRAHGKIRLETYHKRKAFQEKELEALLIRLEREGLFWRSSKGRSCYWEEKPTLKLS